MSRRSCDDSIRCRGSARDTTHHFPSHIARRRNYLVPLKGDCSDFYFATVPFSSRKTLCTINIVDDLKALFLKDLVNPAAVDRTLTGLFQLALVGRLKFFGLLQHLRGVAALTVALFLMLERRLYEANVKSREGSFKTKGPSDFLGNEINGKTFGQIGMGNIAQRIAYTLELLCNSSSHSLSRLGVGGKNIAEIEAHLQEKGLCLRAG